MGIFYGATILQGWRFTYSDLVEMLKPHESLNDLLGILYDTSHFYRDDYYSDCDQGAYYFGIKLVERGLWDTSEPLNLHSLEYNDNIYNQLSRLWVEAFPKLDMPPINYYLFPIIS